MAISVTPFKDGPDYTGEVIIGGTLEVLVLSRLLGSDDSGVVKLSLERARQLSGMLPHVLAEIEANMDPTP